MAEQASEECHGDHVTAGAQAVEKEWQKAWYDGDLKDANRETSKWLIEHVKKLTGGKSACRVLVTMCGAARDMHWLLEQGHEVIGLELVDKALQVFLNRHSIEYTVADVPSVKAGKCYKAKDKKLTLYRCNIFEMDMSLVGKVDCVWDCGAMTDIPPVERVKYAEIILSALPQGGRILAETFTFGEVEGHVFEEGDNHGQDCGHGHGGDAGDDFPCRPVEEKDFEQMYGAKCTIQKLCEEDSSEQQEWGDGWWAKNRLHLLTVK